MIYISWDIEHNILKLVILGHFLLFYHLKYSKSQNFGKWKNLLEIASFCTCVTKITIIRFIVPEIRSETDRIFVILGHFLSFYLSNNPEKKKKKKKKRLEISSFYNNVPKIMIIYFALPEIWSMTNVIIFHFGPFFALLPPITTWKIKILKNWKNRLEISSFYTSVRKIVNICYTVPEIWWVTDVIVIFPFGLFFALLPP